MDIERIESDSSVYALNPQIERRGDGTIILKLDEYGCTYFLLLTTRSGKSIDVFDEKILDSIREKIKGVAGKEQLISLREERILEGIKISCYGYNQYKMCGNAIELPNRAAEYYVLGCRISGGVLRIYMPEKCANCSACVSITVNYRCKKATVEESKRILSKDIISRDYFVVEFEDIPNYNDGDIFYSFDGIPWRFPITEEMIKKKRFFIETMAGRPKFESAVSGLELREH